MVLAPGAVDQTCVFFIAPVTWRLDRKKPAPEHSDGLLTRGARGWSMIIGYARVSTTELWGARRGCPGVQRCGGVRHPESVRRPAAARQAGPGHSRPRRLQHRRPEHGCAELLPLRRSGGRNHRPRDTALGSVVQERFPMRHLRLAPIDLGVINKSASCCGNADSLIPRLSAAR